MDDNGHNGLHRPHVAHRHGHATNDIRKCSFHSHCRMFCAMFMMVVIWDPFYAQPLQPAGQHGIAREHADLVDVV
jgi:hypothetical protein